MQSGVIITMTDREHNVEIDIAVNKFVELQNSRLIQSYSMLDCRFARLATVLKLWNKSFFPNKMKRLNSFTLNLMLIAHMQN